MHQAIGGGDGEPAAAVDESIHLCVPSTLSFSGDSDANVNLARNPHCSHSPDIRKKCWAYACQNLAKTQP